MECYSNIPSGLVYGGQVSIAYGFHDLEYFALKVKQALPGHESTN